MNKELFKKNKKKFFIGGFVLCALGLFVSLAFLYQPSASERYKVEKTWTSEERKQVDPLYIFENQAFINGSKMIMAETSLEDNNYVEHVTMYAGKDFEEEKTVEIVGSRSDGYSMVHDGEFYYVFSDCGSGWRACTPKLYKLDKNLDLDNKKVLEISYDFYVDLIQTNDLDESVMDRIAIDNGYTYIYFLDSKGENSAYKINPEFTSGEIVKLTDTDLEKLYPELAKLLVQEKAHQKSVTDTYVDSNGQPAVDEIYVNEFNFTSLLKVSDTKNLFVGHTNDSNNPVAYFELVDSEGNVLKTHKDSKYVDFSNPVMVDKYIIINASYDTEQTLGTLKSDLLVFNEAGEFLTSLSNNSYFINFVAYEKEVVTERVYVEGTCSADTNSSATYSAWNADSCETHHYYERYKIVDVSGVLGEDDSTTDEKNPETAVFPIIMFIVFSVAMVIFAQYSFNKARDLN